MVFMWMHECVAFVHIHVHTCESKARRGPVDLQRCLRDAIRSALNAHLGILPCTVENNPSGLPHQAARLI